MRHKNLEQEILRLIRIIETNQAALRLATISKADKAQLLLALDQRKQGSLFYKNSSPRFRRSKSGHSPRAGSPASTRCQHEMPARDASTR